VIGIRLAIEQRDFRDGQHRLDDGIDFGVVAALGEIRYTLY
jgi:hypothetical protein